MAALTRAVGRKRAMQMLLTGDFIDAVTPQDWSLINSAVPVASGRRIRALTIVDDYTHESLAIEVDTSPANG